MIVALKYYFIARLMDVPWRITPQTAVPPDQNSLALRARYGVVDNSVVPCVVNCYFSRLLFFIFVVFSDVDVHPFSLKTWFGCV